MKNRAASHRKNTRAGITISRKTRPKAAIDVAMAASLVADGSCKNVTPLKARIKINKTMPRTI